MAQRALNQTVGGVDRRKRRRFMQGHRLGQRAGRTMLSMVVMSRRRVVAGDVVAAMVTVAMRACACMSVTIAMGVRRHMGLFVTGASCARFLRRAHGMLG